MSSKSRVAKAYTGNKVPKFTRWFYPISGIFRDACYALVGSFLLQYAITSGVLSTDPGTYMAQYGVITAAMMVALVWDGINDPIMGFIVEKVHFKLGKFKPWILIGAVGNTLAVILLFLVRPGGNGWAFVALMIAFYVLWDTFFTMNDIGYWAMLPSLTSDEKERATLTSRVTICAAIGGFLMTGAATLLPTMFGGNSAKGAAAVYAVMAVVVSLLFLASQTIVFFFCQEKARDVKQEEASEKSSLIDLFKVVVKNPQVRVVVISIFLYYLASGVLTGGIGMNYYYLSVGYGSASGGLVVTLIAVFYVLSQIASQALYPPLARKISKQKLLLIGTIITMIGAVGFFFTCFPIFGDKSLSTMLSGTAPAYGEDMLKVGIPFAFSGLMFFNYLFPFVFFFGTGLIYMVLLVMFQDSIDYNEYKFGERKESVISAWRPLDVKLGSALLKAFQYLIFLTAGVTVTINGISASEGYLQAGAKPVLDPVTGKQVVDAEGHKVFTPYGSSEFTADIAKFMESVKPSSLVIIGIWVLAILALCFIGVFLLIRFGYKIDEQKHREIVAELEKRHAAVGFNAEEIEQPVAEAEETPAE
jgi:melibiose permease/lactose/raffinose/galactose permease